MEKIEIICLICPLACNIELTVDGENIVDITGFECKKGKEYALQEYKSPQRVLTATVSTTCKTRPLLPVKTAGPVPKKLLIHCMKILAGKEVSPPVTIGQAIVENIMDTEINVVATWELPTENLGNT